MTDFYSGYTDGGSLEHLIQRANAIQAELRARGKAIERRDPDELTNLREGLKQYMDAVPGNPRRTRWFRLTR